MIGVRTGEPQPVHLNGSISVSGTTMDAALASIVGEAAGVGNAPNATAKPGASALSAGPVPGPGGSASPQVRRLRLSRPHPWRIGESLFAGKGRRLGQSAALDGKPFAKVEGDSR
jgi:hypothetical protein